MVMKGREQKQILCVLLQAPVIISHNIREQTNCKTDKCDNLDGRWCKIKLLSFLLEYIQPCQKKITKKYRNRSG